MSHISEGAMRWVVVLLMALVVLAPGGEARAEKRVALVIGNAAYQNTAALNNPSNDAADLSAALQRLGFEVIEGRDLDKRSMERLVRQFGIKLAGADVALFFYAGHGLQVGGQNYLVPTDAKLASEGDVDFESLPVSLVTRQMEREAKTSLILLDACRDNPLSRNLARAMSTRSTQVGQGLAEVKTGVGTLIGFSTQPGYVALDGVGRNSPYAEALLKYIEAPGQDVSGVLVEVRNDVLKATGGKQVPWEHTSLTGQVYLKAGPATATAGAGEPARLPAARGPDPELEIAFWNSVKDSKSPAVIEAYLERYPNGTFAGLAKVMVAQLKGAPVKSPEQPTRVAALPEVPKAPDPRVLARSLQTELERVGCDPGEIDGLWGDKGREALGSFSRHAKVSIAGQEPTPEALEAVTARKERVCPLECGKGTAEVEGKCVATESKTKKSKSASSSRSRERSSESSGGSSSGGGIIGGGGISIGIGGGRGRVGIGL
jgi:uncharacterized membrane protein YgcG